VLDLGTPQIEETKEEVKTNEKKQDSKQDQHKVIANHNHNKMLFDFLQELSLTADKWGEMISYVENDISLVTSRLDKLSYEQVIKSQLNNKLDNYL